MDCVIAGSLGSGFFTWRRDRGFITGGRHSEWFIVRPPYDQFTACHSHQEDGSLVMSTRIRVNPIAYDAHGLCVELLPELIRLDDWGYAVLDESQVPPELPGSRRWRPTGARRWR